MNASLFAGVEAGSPPVEAGVEAGVLLVVPPQPARLSAMHSASASANSFFMFVSS